MRTVNESLVEDTEVRLLLDAMVQCHGYDFREYNATWVKRRIWEHAREEGVDTISGLQEKVLHDDTCVDRLLKTLSIRPAAMFDAPECYQSIRSTAVPILRTYPSASIWVPACGTGEDVYALAVVLDEEGLANRCTIYATDMSESVWSDAKERVMDTESLSQNAFNYRQAGGKAMLSDYYTLVEGRAVLKPTATPIVFAEHNLATDSGFQEFQMIVCRQAFAVYNSWLQERILDVFYHSLSRFGLLGLGPLQMPMNGPSKRYEQIGNGLFRKTLT
jgi:chemotaxis protein methyltransferase CheR